MTTSPEVRDKKIALAERRIAEAEQARDKHIDNTRLANIRLKKYKAELEWLRAMPTDDAPEHVDHLPDTDNPKDAA